MANYLGRQSLNGLQTFALFTAPADGVYFVQGYLTLPQGVATGSSAASQVQAVLKNGGSTVLTGIAGASGFADTQITCSAGDAITVQLSSSAAPDQVINAVRGQVYFGNSF